MDKEENKSNATATAVVEEKVKKKRGRPPKNRDTPPVAASPSPQKKKVASSPSPQKKKVASPSPSPQRKKTTKKRGQGKWGGVEEMAEEFLRVCQFGQTNTARVLLRKGAPINAQDRVSRNTGLHEAAGLGHGELVKVLLKHADVDISLRNIHDETALQVATDPKIKELIQEEMSFRQALVGKRSELYKKIVQGATDRIFAARDDDFVLFVAAKLNMTHILKEYHEQHPRDRFEMLYEQRRTLLHEACRWSSSEAVQYLLDCGADVFSLDAHDKLPSEHVAPQCKELRKIFRKYARKNDIEDERIMLSPTQRALPQQSSEGEEEDDEAAAAVTAADLNNYDDPRSNSTTAAAGTARMSSGGNVTLSREERKLQQLLGILERADSAGTVGPTTTVAAAPPTTTTTPTPVKRGPGRPRKNSHPPAPEEDAKKPTAAVGKGRPKRVKERIGDEVFVIPQDPEDGIFNPNKPREYKKKRRMAVRKASTSSTSSTSSATSLSVVSVANSGGLDPLMRDKATHRTFLHKAASRNNLEKARDLVAKAPQLVGMQDNGGYLALHEAALKGHLDMVKFLLKAGSSVNQPAANGDTPLHDSAENGHVAVVKLLMEKGADPTLKNLQALTPVDVSYDDVFDYFSSLGFTRNEIKAEDMEVDDGAPFERRTRRASAGPTKIEKSVKRRKKRHILNKKEKKLKEPKQKRVKSREDKPVRGVVEVVPSLPASDDVESTKENAAAVAKKPLSVTEKIYLVNHHGSWHFLSKQIERFYEHSLSMKDFAQANPLIYKGMRISSQDYCRVVKNSGMAGTMDASCELLEKNAVYAAFRRDGVPLGSIPVVFSDAVLSIGSSSSSNTSNSIGNDNDSTSSTSRKSVHLPPKMRIKMKDEQGTNQ